MLLAGQARTRARRASTTLASAWRMRSAVVYKKQTVDNDSSMHASENSILRNTTWQGLVRGVLARRRYAIARGRVVRIQALLRGFTKRSIFLKQVAKIITEFPQLLYVRDRYGSFGVDEMFPHGGVDGDSRGEEDTEAGDSNMSASTKPSRCFSTLLHAACESGVMDVIALLEAFPEDVTAVDTKGNSSVHVASSAVDYELVKYLAKRNNVDVEKALVEEKDRSEHAERLSRRQVGTSINVIRAARLERARWAAEANAGGSRGVRAANSGPASLKAKHSLMSGYLRKRRETDRWLKRWCVLTETSLMYFHKPTDESPSKIIKLDKAMLKKSEKVDFAFEIHTPDLLDKRNKEGRLHFSCAGEGELQQWLVPLRVVVALYQFRNDKRRETLVYVDVERRAQLACLPNNKGETPLHALAGASLVDFAGTGRRPTGGRQGLPTLSGRTSVVSMQRLAAWLIESGADPNEPDNSGQTALHVAMECDNPAVVSTLARKGGDVNLKRPCDGRSVITQVLEQGQGMDLIEQVSSAGVTANNPLLPPPEKLFGFTYVSFFIEKTTFPASKHNAVMDLTTPTPNVGAFSAMTGTFNFDAPPSVGGRAGGTGVRDTLNKQGYAKSTMARWGTRIGHVVGAGGGVGRGMGEAGVGGPGGEDGPDGAHGPPPPLGTMTIDRVVEQLFFVRVSVYNAKGKLSEAQQVGMVRSVCFGCFVTVTWPTTSPALPPFPPSGVFEGVVSFGHRWHRKSSICICRRQLVEYTLFSTRTYYTCPYKR
ncbi:unnamed protein product [Ectocarpus sp. 6 AP-2014]